MNKYRIMVADDEEDTRRLLKQMLCDEYEVVTARDGLEVLHQMDRYQPDLFILDVLMPVMNGFDTCEAIRRSPDFASARVIFISAIDSSAEIRQSIASGGDYYLTKPFDAEKIRNQVSDQLKNAPPPKEKRLSLRSEESTQDMNSSPLQTEASPGTGRQVGESPLREDLHLPDRPRLMIVDDDPDICALLSAGLQRKFEIIIANNGQEAILRILKAEPDLVLLDASMPRVNGFELLVSLRRTSQFHDLPVVFLSANSSPRDIRLAKTVGCADFLSKPCPVERVEATLEKVIYSNEFAIKPKRYRIEELTNESQLQAEQKLNDEARESVERDFGELKSYIQSIIQENESA